MTVGTRFRRRLDVEFDIRHVSSEWDEEAGGYLVGATFPIAGRSTPGRNCLSG
jgi:hypothetical protein